MVAMLNFPGARAVLLVLPPDGSRILITGRTDSLVRRVPDCKYRPVTFSEIYGDPNPAPLSPRDELAVAVLGGDEKAAVTLAEQVLKTAGAARLRKPNALLQGWLTGYRMFGPDWADQLADRTETHLSAIGHQEPSEHAVGDMLGRMADEILCQETEKVSKAVSGTLSEDNDWKFKPGSIPAAVMGFAKEFKAQATRPPCGLREEVPGDSAKQGVPLADYAAGLMTGVFTEADFIPDCPCGSCATQRMMRAGVKCEPGTIHATPKGAEYVPCCHWTPDIPAPVSGCGCSACDRVRAQKAR